MHPVAFDPRRVRWIAFDAVDTLIEPAPAVAAVYHRVGGRHGSRLSLEQVAARFRQAFPRLEADAILSCGCASAGDAWHTCEARERLRWQTIVESVLDDVVSREACFAELFAHFSRPSSWRCFPDVEPALSRLRAAGFRLAISSNFDGRLNAVMNGLPPLSPIELRVISSEIGHRKPGGRFFQSLLVSADCLPTELVFVGDNPQTDIAAAAAAGIPGLQIDRQATAGQNRGLRSLDELVDLLAG
jgi:putative hydrolase of the HAD superfamily